MALAVVAGGVVGCGKKRSAEREEGEVMHDGGVLLHHVAVLGLVYYWYYRRRRYWSWYLEKLI